MTLKFKLFRCPSSPSTDAPVTPYAANYISGGNDAFAPPSYEGNKSTNIYGKPVYPTTAINVTGWTADYAPMAQVKTTKDKTTSVEIAFSNPIVAAAYPGIPSKGAMRQNGPTRIEEITDGASNTTLYSEIAGRNRQCYAGKVCQAYGTGLTGMIWADADNRITVTGTDATGTGSIGTGGSAMNTNNMQGDVYSFHTGGANICFADGSVRFVNQNVAITVMAALVTKSGNEVIDPNSY